MSKKLEDPLLTAEEVAAEFDVTVRTVQGWGRKGTHGFPAPVEIGHQLRRWRRSSITAWTKQRARLARRTKS